MQLRAGKMYCMLAGTLPTYLDPCLPPHTRRGGNLYLHQVFTVIREQCEWVMILMWYGLVWVRAIELINNGVTELRC